MTDRRPRILLIDDEEVVLDSCMAILEGGEQDVALASNGADGLDKARAWAPDLVFVDLKMPGMSGTQVLEELRSLDPTIVSIVFTGFATIGSAVEAMKHGAFDFLPKPFTPVEFRALVRRGLERRDLLLERAALRREREALRENFAAIVSHELRSPLAAVQQNLFVTVTELSGVVSDDQRQRLERMSARIGDLLALVNRWLRGFSIDVAPLRESFRPVSVSGPVANALESAETEAVRKAVDIVASVDPAAAVLGDEGALTEAVLNVVGNAVKYSRTGGRRDRVGGAGGRQGRHLGGGHRGRHPRGGRAADLRCVLSRARRGGRRCRGRHRPRPDQAHRRGSRRVDQRDQRPGQGKCLRDHVAGARGAGSRTGGSASGAALERRGWMSERKRVLIVDDDPDFAAGIRAILEGQYDTEVMHSPTDGWNALKKGRYDLLCLDIMMGRGAEGVMMARKIRRDKVLREMPVLIITGLREQIAFLFPGQAVHPGFVPVDELVEKPVEPALLLQKAAALIAASEARQGR